MAIKNVQVRLNDMRPIESEIMDYLAGAGGYSGAPKDLLIAGYKALHGNTPPPAPKPAPKPTKAKPEPKPQGKAPRKLAAAGGII